MSESLSVLVSETLFQLKRRMDVGSHELHLYYTVYTVLPIVAFSGCPLCILQ